MSKRVMIIYPVGGLSCEETLERAKRSLTSEGYDVIDTAFIESIACHDGVNTQVYLLSKYIERMSTCDAVYCQKGWDKDRRCIIEQATAVGYGLDVIYEE